MRNSRYPPYFRRESPVCLRVIIASHRNKLYLCIRIYSYEYFGDTYILSMQINAYKYIFVFLIQYFPTQNPDSHTSPTMLAIAFHSFLIFSASVYPTQNPGSQPSPLMKAIGVYRRYINIYVDNRWV